MTITSYIDRILNIFMHERRDLVFVWEVYFNRKLFDFNHNCHGGLEDMLL